MSGGEKERAGVAEEESGEIGRARQRRPVCHGADLSGEPLKDLKGRRGSILHDTKITLHVQWKMGYREKSWR